MNAPLEIVIDVICPWCFIAKRKLDLSLQVLPIHSVKTVEWLPYELDPNLSEAGEERLKYRIRRFGSAQASHERDLSATQAGKEVGISFRYDLITKTPNTRNAHRLIWWFKQMGLSQIEVVDSIFRAYFLEGEDIGQIEVLVKIADKLVGGRKSEVLSFLESLEGVTEVLTLQDRSRARGLTSVPAYFYKNQKVENGLELIFKQL